MNDQLRKRALGAPAARSLLLTVLGEYVLPRADGVWQETLVSALTTLDYSHQGARQALARSIRDGWLRVERHGRRARTSLDDSTRSLLQTGAERIYSFGVAQAWDGRWLIVLLRVPEDKRSVRHQLRSQLAWSGFGSLGGGVWITPHAHREEELLQTLATQPMAEAISFVGSFGAVSDPAQVIAAAWDLEAVRQRYDDFIATFSRVRPVGGEACFREQTLLVHAWRKFPFLDPDLPEAVLPDKWPRARAHELFIDHHDRWAETAQHFFAQLEESVAPARPWSRNDT